MKEVKIILTGAGGRMGKAVMDAASHSEFCKIIAGIDISPMQSSIPMYGGIGEVSKNTNADVIIDFSHHSAIEGILKYATDTGTAVVICTTGHTDEELKMMKAASEKIPVFHSGNMSLGINLLMSLVKKAAAVLDGFDIEIIEKHHNQKLDAPSGTALMLAKCASDSLSYKAEYIYDRHTERKKRDKKEIGMHSVRGGSIVGEHDVIFAGSDEVITLSHSASSRDVFAQGALKAANFIAGKTPGMYDMQDVVG